LDASANASPAPRYGNFIGRYKRSSPVAAVIV